MELRLELNRMNPAEYYGSLGFLELLSQQDPGLLSHFAGDGNLVTFVVAGDSLVLPDLASLPLRLCHSMILTRPQSWSTASAWIGGLTLTERGQLAENLGGHNDT